MSTSALLEANALDRVPNEHEPFLSEVLPLQNSFLIMGSPDGRGAGGRPQASVSFSIWPLTMYLSRRGACWERSTRSRRIFHERKSSKLWIETARVVMKRSRPQAVVCKCVCACGDFQPRLFFHLSR